MAITAIRRLTKAQIEKYRKLLVSKDEEVRANFRSVKAGRTLALGERTSNLEDLPTLSHEEWIFINRNSIDVMLQREIKDALDRIAEGDYGTCAECDELISPKRLGAIPWARYCISCQEELAALEAEEEAAAASPTKR